MQMYKHVGKIINTDARCVVVYMQIPGREDHALIVNMDSTPPHFERPIRAVVESADGQAAYNLAEVLSRRLMPETGVRILDALHNARLLQAVHIDNIVMMPRPSMAFPLRQVIASMANHNSAPLPAQTDFSAEKFNPHLHNQAMRTLEERTNIARGLLAEAADLSSAASMKIEKAYTMAPELRPAAAAPVLAPRLDIVQENLDIASLPMDFVEPELIDFKVETATASAAEIERYAAMMMGEVPADQPKPAKAKVTKPAAKTTKKAPTKASKA